MPRKRSKVVLIIVEGPTDETALEQFFSEKFDPNEVRIKVVHGDITADEDSTPSNIVSSVGRLVRNWAPRYGLKRQDFLKVIHVTDTDGTYIPPENVVEDPSHLGRPLYGDANIVASPGSRIKEQCAEERQSQQAEFNRYRVGKRPLFDSLHVL